MWRFFGERLSRKGLSGEWVSSVWSRISLRTTIVSPATGRSAFARQAHSRNMPSFGSRHSFTVPRSCTFIALASTASRADRAHADSQKSFSVKTRKTPTRFRGSGDHVMAHGLFECLRRCSAMLGTFLLSGRFGTWYQVTRLTNRSGGHRYPVAG